MAAEAAPEWNGVVERPICAPLESKVWCVASNFLRFPNLLTIEVVDGEHGVAGCTLKVSNMPRQWDEQKLVEINPQDQHLFSDEFLENINTGVAPGTTPPSRHSRKVGRLWCDGHSGSALPKLDVTAHFILSGTSLYLEELEKLAAT